MSGTYHTWLADQSSASVAEGKLKLGKATVLDCAEDAAEDSFCGYGEVNPNDPAGELTEPSRFGWLGDDIYYLMQDNLDPWRTEAVITSEGDLQLTVHHALTGGQDFRFAFAIAPDFQPNRCIQSGQTCFAADGEPTDNDGDGWIDAADPDCLYGSWELGYGSTACNDGVDNDADGDIDFDDADCEHAWDNDERSLSGSCTDGVDNDGDTWIDNDDVDCEEGEESGDTNALFDCSNGLDDDGDGDFDGDDSACDNARDNNEDGPAAKLSCVDKFDNDGDGLVDGADPDCEYYDTESGWGTTACNDNADNDGDGLVDALDDGCTDALRPTEELADETCSDGDDNDSDGWTDLDDPDCWFGTAEDDSFFGLSGCNDGLDNEVLDTGEEADGIDADDRNCKSALQLSEESLVASSCRDGSDTEPALDEDGDGWINDADPDCFTGTREEGLSVQVCNDGQDNDGDGLVDFDDTGCLSAWRTTEEDLSGASDCDNGLDDDGDGWTDAEDAGCIYDELEAAGPDTECGDGLDNDGDGFVDGELDGDGNTFCYSALDTVEFTDDGCADGLDNDGDGWTDIDDTECTDYGYEIGFRDGDCQDGLDNDGDGLVDALDDGCTAATDAGEEDSNECTDGLDNDSDGWSDAQDPDCAGGSVVESGDLAIYQCNDGSDNDGDGATDGADSDCDSAWDNIEDTEDAGEPVPYAIDHLPILEQWSADEEGTIYYLNAASYQLNPADDEDFWSFPQEWRAGYAAARFAAEDFTVESPDYFYLGLPFDEPDTEYYESVVDEFRTEASIWDAELATYGATEGLDMEVKVEGNSWRPLDTQSAGLDNWVEMHPSYVIIDDGSSIEVGGSVSGSYQILFAGLDSASHAVVKGTFSVEKLRDDRWGYPVLQDELRERNDTLVCE